MYLLPQPKTIQEKKGQFQLTYKGNIRMEDTCPFTTYETAKLLQQEIKKTLGFQWDIKKVTNVSCKKDIVLSLSQEAILKTEGYRISITEQKVQIIGMDEVGLMYGIQTLRQIIRQCGAILPSLEIEDEPSIKDRGFYFDVTRGRIPTLEELKKLADTCAFYKLNQLQLYVEDTFLFEGYSETWRENTPLTSEEIMELDAYCLKRHIELVPSLASFGHLYGILKTKTYGHLCELEEPLSLEFSLVDRMRHHTVDVSNPESLLMVEDRILQYMKLFTSDKFNICADETFDLGKGRSKNLAEKVGVTRIYLDFLKKLCDIVIKAGKIPMYWGDILVESPEYIGELPSESICLNWEYSPVVTEDNIKALTNAGAKRLYVCPGVQSWSNLINKHHDAYLNILGMCRNAHKYGTMGVLNTCWGDCGHISHPEFSTVGLIYGAAFSWSDKELSEEEINKEISFLEYGDRSEKMVSLIANIADAEAATWWALAEFKEEMCRGKNAKEQSDRLLVRKEIDLKKNLAEAEKGINQLYQMAHTIKSDAKEKLAANLLMAEGQRIWSIIAYTIVEHVEGRTLSYQPSTLACKLEEWLMDYKDLWRSVSKESELNRIVEVVCWYADYLRDLK